MFVKCLIYILLSFITFSMLYVIIDRICKCIEHCKTVKTLEDITNKQDEDVDKYII